MNRYQHVAHSVPCKRCGAPEGKPCISIVNWPEYKPLMYADAVKDPYQREMRNIGGSPTVHKQRFNARFWE